MGLTRGVTRAHMGGSNAPCASACTPPETSPVSHRILA